MNLNGFPITVVKRLMLTHTALTTSRPSVLEHEFSAKHYGVLCRYMYVYMNIGSTSSLIWHNATGGNNKNEHLEASVQKSSSSPTVFIKEQGQPEHLQHRKSADKTLLPLLVLDNVVRNRNDSIMTYVSGVYIMIELFTRERKMRMRPMENHEQLIMIVWTTHCSTAAEVADIRRAEPHAPTPPESSCYCLFAVLTPDNWERKFFLDKVGYYAEVTDGRTSLCGWYTNADHLAQILRNYSQVGKLTTEGIGDAGRSKMQWAYNNGTRNHRSTMVSFRWYKLWYTLTTPQVSRFIAESQYKDILVLERRFTQWKWIGTLYSRSAAVEKPK